MTRRAIRKIKYKLLPVFLCIALIFSFTFTSNVFSPSPAHAVAIVDDIIIGGTIIAWLSAAGIAVSGALANGDSTPEALIQGLQELTYQFDTAVNQSVGFLWNQLVGAYLDTEIFLEETLVNPTISIAYDAWSLLSGFNDWLIDEFSLIDDQTIASELFSTYGFYLDDGTPITYYSGSVSSSTAAKNAFDSLPDSSKFLVDQTYTNAYDVLFRCTRDGNVYTWSYDSEGAVVNFNSWTMNSSTPYVMTRYAFSWSGNNTTRTWLRELLNTSTDAYSYNYANTTSPVSLAAFDAIFQQAENMVDGLGKDLLPELDTSEYDTESAWITSSWDSLVDSLPVNPTLEDVARAYLEAASDGSIAAESDNVATRSISDEKPSGDDDDDKDPTVVLPLIGIGSAGLGIPSIISGMASIWQYVITWVGSLASWFSFMFSVFANLPYAMVVPIYASVVVVIVLGLYKRFFM